MSSWTFLASAPAPDDGAMLALYRRGKEFSIRVGDVQLMDSCIHGSEDALAELACARLDDPRWARVLIGGLGMGFTVAAALRNLGPEGRVEVAEIVPAVVAWNRGELGAVAGRPLDDPRVNVRGTDVARVLRAESGAYDAILLDVDNGPVALTRRGNNWLYADVGLRAAFDALRAGGVLGVWSARTNPAFAKRLRGIGFAVEEIASRARGPSGGPEHIVWIAQRP